MNDEQRVLTEKVLAQVERQPESLDMASWCNTENDDRQNWKTGWKVEGCGTTRCIAGWTVYFASRPGEEEYAARQRIAREAGLDSWSHMTVGRYLLGLNGEEAQTLFLDLDEPKAVAFLRARIDQS